MYLIKNAMLCAPAPLGKKDVLIGGGKILKIADELPVEEAYGVEVLDASGYIMMPGLIDNHVHILGGGGEGGARTRTPELALRDMIKGGVTTVIGCLGTDGCTRTMTNLIAKAKGLEEEGVSAYICTGSYQVPVRTLTGSIMDDMILVDRIIACGEIAVSDHRSSQPTKEEFAKIVADARVGGILSAKSGVTIIHLGDGRRKLEYLRYVLDETEIPVANMLPTHINRNPDLMEDGIAYAREYGGNIDFTTSITPGPLSDKEMGAADALKRALDEGIPIEQITFSSDGQGSLPVFAEDGSFAGLGVGMVTSLYHEVKQAVQIEGVPLDQAIKTVTENPARIFKLQQKGRIAAGMDADLILADEESLDIEAVLAKGQLMMWENKMLVKGTFDLYAVLPDNLTR